MGEPATPALIWGKGGGGREVPSGLPSGLVVAAETGLLGNAFGLPAAELGEPGLPIARTAVDDEAARPPSERPPFFLPPGDCRSELSEAVELIVSSRSIGPGAAFLPF